MIFKKTKKNFYIDYALSTQNIALLQSAFPELNIIVTGKVNHPHAMPAVTRNCAETFILSLVNYDQNVKRLNSNKDVFIVDVGANYVRHIKNGRFNIHCCNPICDIRDSARENEKKSKLKLVVNEELQSSLKIKSVITTANLGEYMRVVGEWNGYYLYQQDVHVLVCVCDSDNMNWNIECMLKWCDSDFARVC
ncbi:Methyltransferase/helicase/RNA-directed RNA polymerase [Cyphomyrmex costatus]|uniref:Methyltransferase/helicase/RNA-directed RNA polymerase n=1 Tax=Cyphomyrmex costatus TaxID=456900 RepID=A0A151IC93_9HYME|nr:Methyltransferase/helicase/RNA-directed RNA polymerase [Cyphomyrmex costatus]